jgi:hypothetical protein
VNSQESTSQFGGGKMHILHARSHMSVRLNGGFLTDHSRNGAKKFMLMAHRCKQLF